MSMNHSGSAYSLLCVMPSGMVTIASTQPSCHAPEREGREPAEREPRVAGALHDVVAGAHQRRAAEREDHAERVVGANAAEGQPRHAEIERRPRHLGGGEHADRHADDAPDRGGEQEQPYDLVVVGFSVGHDPSHSFEQRTASNALHPAQRTVGIDRPAPVWRPRLSSTSVFLRCLLQSNYAGKLADRRARLA